MTLRALMLALVTVLLAGFSSCSKSDDDNTKTTTTPETPATPETPTKELTGCTFTLEVEASEDELAIGDVTIEYLDENGKTQSESIKEKKWSKTLTYTAFPAKVAYTLKHKLKEGVELSKESYNLNLGIKPTCYIVFSDKTTKASEQPLMKQYITESIKKDYVADHFKKEVFYSTELTLKKAASGTDIVVE